MEVPTIYKAYFSGLCKGISQQNMAQNMVLTYLHQLDPGIPIDPDSQLDGIIYVHQLRIVHCLQGIYLDLLIRGPPKK